MLLMILKKISQINDQFSVRKNNGKFTKKNQCEISKLMQKSF